MWLTSSSSSSAASASAASSSSSPTQRPRPKLRAASIGHNNNGSSTSTSHPNSPTKSSHHNHANGNGQHHALTAATSARLLYATRKTKSNLSQQPSHNKKKTKKRWWGCCSCWFWSVTKCSNLVMCLLVLLMAITIFVNSYHPYFGEQRDLILEPEEPADFGMHDHHHHQDAFYHHDEAEADEEQAGAVAGAEAAGGEGNENGNAEHDEVQIVEIEEVDQPLVRHEDAGVIVSPHLGPLPQDRRRRRQERRKKGKGFQRRQEEQGQNEQQQQQQQHRFQRQKQQQQQQQQQKGRFRGQKRQTDQLPQQRQQQEQDQLQQEDQEVLTPQQRWRRRRMMMMRFKYVEHFENQILKRNKYGQVVFRPVTNVSQSDLALDDRFLPDEEEEDVEEQQTRDDRQQVLDLLTDAGVVNLDLATIKSLPTNEQLLQLYGPGPVIFGEDSCPAFQQQVPAWDASVGPAGLFNTGTNPMAMYLEANCMIVRNRQHNRGMRWQVPWGKHMLASRKWTNTAKNDYTVNKKHVLPVVMIRDPYMWMQSLCKHRYATKWYHSKAHCPSLVPTLYDRFLFPWIRADNLVVRVWKGTHWPSLAHFWTDWYQQYYRADYPRLIVRFEDLIYHPRELTERICKCAGGVLRSEKEGTPFTYVVDSGKWGPAHGGKRTNLVSAMIKYGTDKKRFNNMTQADLQYAYEALDPEMMQIFQYAVSAPP